MEVFGVHRLGVGVGRLGHRYHVGKDRMRREILGAFEANALEIASVRYEISGVPPLRVEVARADG